MKDLASIILAAGQSTRMKSSRSKVLHDLAGRPVVSYPIAAARSCGADPIIVVRGPKQDDLSSYLREQGLAEAIQREPLGTAHAASAGMAALGRHSGLVLILCGDAPLVRPEEFGCFVRAMRAQKAQLGVLTMQLEEPGAYGRIVRDLDGRMIHIVEAKDATDEQRRIREVNTGVICAEAEWLAKALARVGCDNVKQEYYLTDLVGLAMKEGVKRLAHRAADAHDFLAINNRVELAQVARIMRERINRRHMMNGVGILDDLHTIVDADVTIGADTSIAPFSFLQGNTRIGANSIIENGVVIRDCVVGSGVHIKAHSVLEGSRIADGAIVGPFARIRPDSKVGRAARVGNFVELKKCDLKDGAKANHLTYLGDATVGRGANIGCGTITCNYDGVNKHRTIIGEETFIGSDTQFIAPVRVGRGATIGAGSTITKDVPAGALGISRAEQKVVRGWAKRKKR